MFQASKSNYHRFLFNKHITTYRMNDIYCIGDLGRGDDSMVGGYHRAAPSTINQSNVTAPSGRIEHWVNASAQTSPIQIQSSSQSINKINQSIKTINQLSNNSMSSIKQFNQQSLLQSFKFMPWSCRLVGALLHLSWGAAKRKTDYRDGYRPGTADNLKIEPKQAAERCPVKRGLEVGFFSWCRDARVCAQLLPCGF